MGFPSRWSRWGFFFPSSFVSMRVYIIEHLKVDNIVRVVKELRFSQINLCWHDINFMKNNIIS